MPEGNVLRTQPCSIVTNHRVSRRMRGSRYQMDTSTDSETTSTSEDDARCLRPRMRNVHDDDEDYSTSSDGCESEHRPPPRKTRGKNHESGKNFEILNVYEIIITWNCLASPTDVSGRFGPASCQRAATRIISATSRRRS